MNMKDLSDKLEECKKKLQFHMEKFNFLREQGKSREALEELKMALNFASETLQYSNALLHQINHEIGRVPQEQKQKILQKIDTRLKSREACPQDRLLNIHLPGKKVIH
jgi:phage-related tail protein